MFNFTGRARGLGPRARRRASDPLAVERLEARMLLAAAAWDGEGLDGDWHNPLNWVGDVIPAAGDDVTIAAGAGPSVSLNVGNSARVRSLDAERALSIAGTLTVTSQTRIGLGALTVLPGGDLRTRDLWIGSSGDAVANAGHWRILGVGLIERRIQSTGVLTLAEESSTTLGLGAGGQFGSIDAPEGVLNIGRRARVTGGGPQAEQILVGEWVNVGDASVLHSLGMVARGVDRRVNLNFSSRAPAAITDGSLRLGNVYARGGAQIHDSSVTVDGVLVIFGRISIGGGSLDVQDHVLGGVLETDGTPVTLDGSGLFQRRLVMNVDGRIANGQVILSSDVIFLRSSQRDGMAIHGSVVTGSFRLEARTLLDVVIGAGTTVSAERIGTLRPLFGRPTALVIRGRLEATSTRWDAGSISLDTPESRLVVPGHFTITGDHDFRRILGQGRLNIGEGGVLTSAISGQAVIETTVSNQGRVNVLAGELVLRGDLVQFTAAGVLRPSDWLVSDGATLTITEGDVIRNRANITVGAGGAIPALSRMEVNAGVITLSGAGIWASGQNNPVAFANVGLIRKTGEGVRWIFGDIIQSEQGQIEIDGGRLHLETSRFHNAGSIRIGWEAIARDRVSLLVTGDFTQSADATLALYGTHRDGFGSLPRVLAGDRMVLDGTLVASIHPNTLQRHPNKSIWRFANAARRSGEFAHVTLTVPNAGEVLTYTGTQALITVIR